MTLSIVIITFNEEANIRRTLESVLPLADETIVVDSGSTDRTVEIARELGAKVFVEEWKGYAAQKNSAIAKASSDWILSLDADEQVSGELAAEIQEIINRQPAGREWRKTTDPVSGSVREELRPGTVAGYSMPRKNFFLHRWIRHGGFWPDRKLRLFRRGTGRFEERLVHETMQVDGATGKLDGPLLHHAYPTLHGYIATMNRYSSLGAEVARATGHGGFSFVNIVLRPLATFVQKYFLRLGFLDGREGLLLCLYHSVYVSWKYAKAWELAHSPADPMTR